LRLKAVILNDTRGDNHFGCMRVMRILEENLVARGIDVTATSLVRNDWSRDQHFLVAMQATDLIIINGEGTLHHGSKQGSKLLEIVDHPARGTIPVALINAVYQDNPAAWSAQLSRMSFIMARDSWSANEFSTAIGRDVDFVADLSLAEGPITPSPSAQRNRLLVGDSVNRDITEQMLRFVDARQDSQFLPILTSIKPPKPHYPPPLRALRQVYIDVHAAAFGLRHRRTEFNVSEAGFVNSLATGYLHLTGRFHAICLCLATATPFLALESNSWKISALLRDFGLSTDRIVTFEQACERLANNEVLDFTDEEREKINSGLLASKRKASDLFDRLLLLASARQIEQ
jgi:Polysaccharide pyruvyl transferase